MVYYISWVGMWFTGYYFQLMLYTVKPILSDHSKTDKTQILITNGSLMQVENIAERRSKVL